MSVIPRSRGISAISSALTILDIDSKISQVISLRFNKQSFWEKGKFPSTITNTTTGDVIKLINPWLASEQNSAPFDQRESLRFASRDD